MTHTPVQLVNEVIDDIVTTEQSDDRIHEIKLNVHEKLVKAVQSFRLICNVVWLLFVKVKHKYSATVEKKVYIYNQYEDRNIVVHNLKELDFHIKSLKFCSKISSHIFGV